MGCFMQPLSAMDHVHVGPGITSFLIPRYSVQDTPPTLYQTDFLSKCGFTQMPSPGGCWMLQHLFRLFVRSWNVFCLHPEDWAGSPWDEGFQSQFCLYSAHSSFLFFPPPALINYFLMCWFLPEKHWEFLRFLTERSVEKVKIWIRECLSEQDLIEGISVSKHFTFVMKNFTPAINSGLDLNPYFCTRSRAKWTVQSQWEPKALPLAPALPVFMWFRGFFLVQIPTTSHISEALQPLGTRIFRNLQRRRDPWAKQIDHRWQLSSNPTQNALCLRDFSDHLLLLPLIRWVITSDDSFKIIIWTKQAIPMGKLGVCVLVRKMPLSPL